VPEDQTAEITLDTTSVDVDFSLEVMGEVNAS
jgi:hypothetical protein